MGNLPLPKYPRILAIAPSTRGLGFAVIEEQETLADWGTKPAKGDKNKESLAKLKEMLKQFQPDLVVFQDCMAKGSKRSERIRELGRKMIAMVKRAKIKVELYPREQVMSVLGGESVKTKYDLAQVLASWFPEELGFQLPPKRRAWMSEHSRMDYFAAVGLALMPKHSRQKKAQKLLKAFN